MSIIFQDRSHASEYVIDTLKNSLELNKQAIAVMQKEVDRTVHSVQELQRKLDGHEDRLNTFEKGMVKVWSVCVDVEHCVGNAKM